MLTHGARRSGMAWAALIAGSLPMPERLRLGIVGYAVDRTLDASITPLKPYGLTAGRQGV